MPRFGVFLLGVERRSLLKWIEGVWEKKRGGGGGG